jgi:hypothetical protein
MYYRLLVLTVLLAAMANRASARVDTFENGMIDEVSDSGCYYWGRNVHFSGTVKRSVTRKWDGENTVALLLVLDHPVCIESRADDTHFRKYSGVKILQILLDNDDSIHKPKSLPPGRKVVIWGAPTFEFSWKQTDLGLTAAAILPFNTPKTW